jgi:hypothetical protein
MEADRRSYLRFETVLPVLIETPGQETQRYVARNVSCGGLCLETREPLPLGTPIRVWFVAPDGTRIGASGLVRNHYVFNYRTGDRTRQCRGMGVRFTAFHDSGERALRSVIERMLAAH